MALGTVTVGSASKFHAERSGREIQGSHGDPFRALFAFNFDRQFLANIFSSPPPSLKAYPTLCLPNIQSNTKIDTICPNRIPQKRPNGCRHPSFFRIHVDNINFLTPQHQFSPGKPMGGLALKMGGVLGNWTNEKSPHVPKVDVDVF